MTNFFLGLSIVIFLLLCLFAADALVTFLSGYSQLRP